MFVCVRVIGADGDGLIIFSVDHDTPSLNYCALIKPLVFINLDCLHNGLLVSVIIPSSSFHNNNA